MSLTKTVYLLIEFDKRELDSKLLLGYHLVAQGYRVVIGQQWAIMRNIANLPPGIICFKSYHKIYWYSMILAKKHGFIVFAIEEELFGAISQSIIRSVADKKIEQFIDEIISNGPSETLYLNSLGLKSQPFGNIRGTILNKKFSDYVDLNTLQPEYEYPDNFIQINTNFGAINSRWKSLDFVRQAAIQSGVLNPKDDLTVKLFEDSIKMEEFGLEMVKKFLESNSEKDLRIVLRPHPNEDIGTWNEYLRKFKNVQISRNGSHVPLTRRSNLLIHVGCTTGFEAALMRVPALSIMSDSKNDYASGLVSNYVNPTVTTLEEINSFIKSYPDDLLEKNFEKSAELIYGANSEKPIYDFVNLCDSYLRDAQAPKDLGFKDLGDVAHATEKCSITQDIINKKIQILSGNCESNVNVHQILPSLFYLESTRDKKQTSTFVSEIEILSHFKGDNLNRSPSEFLSATDEILDRLLKEPPSKIHEVFLKHISTLQLREQKDKLLAHLIKSGVRVDLEVAKLINKNEISDIEFLSDYNNLIKKYSKNKKIFFHVLYALIEYKEFSERWIRNEPKYHCFNVEELGFRHTKFEFDILASLTAETIREAKNIDYSHLDSLAFCALHKDDLKIFSQAIESIKVNFPKSTWMSVLDPLSTEHYQEKYQQKFSDFYTKSLFEAKVLQPVENERIIFISSDLNYFKKFSVPLIKSALKQSPLVKIALEVIDVPSSRKNDVFTFIKNSFPNICELIYTSSVGFSNSDYSRKCFYHISRFFSVHHLLMSKAKAVLMLDTDSLVANPIESIFSTHAENDIALRIRPGRRHPWNQYNASTVLFNSTSFTKAYVSRLSYYLYQLLLRDNVRWGADQLAMYLVHRFSFQFAGKIGFFDEDIVDYDCNDGGIIWQNSGVRKHFLEFSSQHDDVSRRYANYLQSLTS